MHAVVVANGEMTDDARLRAIWAKADLRVAADGGARNARLYLGRAPQVVIGDMDSLDEETRGWLDAAQTERIQHPRAKDETDLELALALAHARGAAELTILGAFGGRTDHFLANVMLLTRTPHLKITAAASEVWMGSGDDSITGTRGDTVSLIPIDMTVEGITTTDLEYPLRGETLERGSTRGISNVMLGEHAQVRWTRGALLIVHLFGQ